MHVHGVHIAARIQPHPAYFAAQRVFQALGIGPRLSVDHWNIERFLRKLAVAPHPNDEYAIWRYRARWIHDECAVQLAVFLVGPACERVAAGGCPVVVSARCARGKCHIAGRAAGHLKGVVILSRTRMHAVDQDIPCDQVMYGDVDPGVLRNANHRSGDLQLLAALRESEYLETRPRFIFRIKCAFADLEFYCELARGQNSRRVLIRIRCNAWQRGVSDGGCLAARGSEKRWPRRRSGSALGLWR